MSDRSEVGQLVQVGRYVVTYQRNCPDYDPCWGDECVVLKTALGEVLAHWHTKRFWRRNRTVAECVVQALYAIQERALAERREQTEFQAARDFAQQLVTDGILEGGSRG